MSAINGPYSQSFRFTGISRQHNKESTSRQSVCLLEAEISWCAGDHQHCENIHHRLTPLLSGGRKEKKMRAGTTLFNRHYSEGDDPRIRVISDRPLIIWKMMKKKGVQSTYRRPRCSRRGSWQPLCWFGTYTYIDDQLQNVFIRRNKREKWYKRFWMKTDM